MRSHTVDIHACKICHSVLKNIPSTEGHIKRQHRNSYDQYRANLLELMTPVNAEALGIDTSSIETTSMIK